MSERGERQTINLADLPIQQLMQLKQELEQEVRYRQTQYETLHGAKSRFEASRSTMKKLNETKQESKSQILIPMTQSIYQSGELLDSERFIVDIGAGYLVERSYDGNKRYLDKRIKQIEDNLEVCGKQLVEKRKVQEFVNMTLQAKVGVQSAAASASASASA